MGLPMPSFGLSKTLSKSRAYCSKQASSAYIICPGKSNYIERRSNQLFGCLCRFVTSAQVQALPHIEQDYLKEHGLLAGYDLSGTVVVEVHHLLQEQSMPVELVCCVNLGQDVPADCKANGLQLPNLQLTE